MGGELGGGQRGLPVADDLVAEHLAGGVAALSVGPGRREDAQAAGPGTATRAPARPTAPAPDRCARPEAPGPPIVRERARGGPEAARVQDARHNVDRAARLLVDA